MEILCLPLTLRCVSNVMRDDGYSGGLSTDWGVGTALSFEHGGDAESEGAGLGVRFYFGLSALSGVDWRRVEARSLVLVGHLTPSPGCVTESAHDKRLVRKAVRLAKEESIAC